jgi:large subunit ribosomal protein L3
MGTDRVTVKELEIVQADPERNLLVIKGSVPGPNGGIVLIRKSAGQLALAARSAGKTARKQA